MLQIKIITLGKIKHNWLQQALYDYEKRLEGRAKILWFLGKTDSDWSSLISSESFYTLLDIQGVSLSSTAFSQFLFKQAKHTFVIGGDIGVPLFVIERASFRLSFSSLTFTHQMMRLLLLEQIYRASEIFKGSLYHK